MKRYVKVAIIKIFPEEENKRKENRSVLKAFDSVKKKLNYLKFPNP